MIVHVITGLRQGGAENALYRLLLHLPDRDQVRVVSLTDGGYFESRLKAAGIPIVCLGMRSALSLPLGWWRLYRLLREWHPDLVQTWMYHADLLGGLAGRLAGVPVCWGIRQSDLSRRHSKTMTRFVAKCCAMLSGWLPRWAISCSKRAVAVHKALGYVVPFSVIPNGLDVSRWHPVPGASASVRARLEIADGEFVFAHAGRSDPQKDHRGLALAFGLLHADRPDVRLLMMGEGMAEGDDRLERLPFGPSRRAVVALGARDDLPELFLVADAFVLSSAYGEAFPNVVAEAMACGLPCVVTDVGDAADIVGDTGIVVPPSDVDALAGAMRAMRDMPPPGRAERSVAAVMRVRETYSMERMSAAYLRVWRALISGAKMQCAD